MSELNKTIRIRTTPGGGGDKNLSIKLEQNFDFLEVLSLKISQEDMYTNFCSNYGVVIGRVIANKGFGVPNAKVSVFIPITSEDETNELIRDLYPFKNVKDVDKNGVRYNLLLSEQTCDLNAGVGTFPSKEDLLNNDIFLEIFDKYYKYTTKTNQSGDYMIFGVPTGTKIIHMDTDVSDISYLSIRPYDLVSQGASENFFDTKDGTVRFKTSNNLDTLIQIKSDNQSVDVIPFWGDPSFCEIGITRVDFDLPDDITPTSVFTGSIFTDNDDNALKKSCGIKNELGDVSQLQTGPGVVDILKLNVSEFGVPTDIQPLPSKSIDEDGVFLFTLPMYYDRVVTNESGELVRSNNPNIGIPTKGKYRFKIKFENNTTLTNNRGNKNVSTASLIVPSIDNFVRFSTELEDYDGALQHFNTFEWKQIYTTSQFIRKLKRKKRSRWGYIGLKNINFKMVNPADLDDGDDVEDEVSETNNNLTPPYNTILRRSGAATTKTKKIGLSFHDSYLNGGLYLFKFKVKIKLNGEIKCCGNKKDFFIKEDGASYLLNAIIERRSFLTPESDNTGSSDTDEFVYCKWALDTEIINIGSVEMCGDTLQTLEDSLSEVDTEPLIKFKKGGDGVSSPCLGTNKERGIRTQILVNDLKDTTYLDLNEQFPYHVDKDSNWGEASALGISSWFHDNNNETYKAQEIKLTAGDNNYGHYIPYYCRIDYDGINDDGNVTLFDSYPFNGTVITSELNNEFGCTAFGQNNYYPPRTDKVYFYFGITPGKTALDKLRKDYFIN